MNYAEEAKKARLKVLDLIYKAQTSHIGSNFSCIDILSVLFDKIDLDKDKFVLSAGWKAASLYYFLWKKGRITEEELNSYCQPESKWIGLSEPIHPDIPFAGGSMCMGVAAGIGFALAKKLKNETGKIYILESDGGMDGGITWEAAAIAAQHKLDNLTVICDRNGFQAMGKTDEILDKKSLKEKWKAFGWDVWEIDGHNYQDIGHALICSYGHCNFEKLINCPKIIIANTIKGKGVSFMENNNDFHYLHISKENYKQALAELQR